MHSLIDFLRPFLINADQEALLRSVITRQSISKEYYLLRTGEVCRNVFYIRKGACYKYQQLKGKPQVAQFYTAGDLTADFQSFLFQRPTEFSIKVHRKVDVDVLSFGALHELYDRDVQIERMARLLMEPKLDGLMDLFWSLRQDSPEIRYLKLREQRPVLFEQFPQFLIASYLGITPVGLSKIRKRLTKR